MVSRQLVSVESTIALGVGLLQMSANRLKEKTHFEEFRWRSQNQSSRPPLIVACLN